MHRLWGTWGLTFSSSRRALRPCKMRSSFGSHSMAMTCQSLASASCLKCRGLSTLCLPKWTLPLSRHAAHGPCLQAVPEPPRRDSWHRLTDEAIACNDDSDVVFAAVLEGPLNKGCASVAHWCAGGEDGG